MDKAKQDEVKRRFGARVRQLRKAMAGKVSQERLAFDADLDRSYVSGIERGKKNLSLVNIHRLAKALGVEAGELFGE